MSAERWEYDAHDYIVFGTTDDGASDFDVCEMTWFDHTDASGVREMDRRGRLIAEAPALLAFAAQVARMTTDDESEMASEDAIATVNGLIAAARALTAAARGGK